MQIAFDRTAVFVCGTCVRWHFGGWTGQCWRAPLSVSWALVFGYSVESIHITSIYRIRCVLLFSSCEYKVRSMLPYGIRYVSVHGNAATAAAFFFDVLRRQTNFLSVLCACDVFYFLYLLILGTVQYGLF